MLHKADKSTDSFGFKVRNNYNQNTMEKGLKIPAGLYRGIVVNNEDPHGMGRIKVQIQKFYGTMEPGLDSAISDDLDFLGAQWCRVLLPAIGGTTGAAGGGQSAYGINGLRPDKDNEVLVAFSSDSTVGFILGVLPDEQKVRYTAAGPSVGQSSDGEVGHVQEVPKTARSISEQPKLHPQQEKLKRQKLERDRLRGLNYSSVARDPTPRVVAMTSRTGHAVILDDGSLEEDDNKLVRIRSAAGAQILMDDVNEFIYIINQNGTSWIEMNRNGDIDVYSKGGLNFGTPGAINFHCGSDFNIHAGGSVNVRSAGNPNDDLSTPIGIKLESMGTFNVFSEKNMMLETNANGNLKVRGNYKETASRIDMNGPPAAPAERPTMNSLVGNTQFPESIASRVPEEEPWKGHLDVSVLDTSSTSGAATGDPSYYDGSPPADVEAPPPEAVNVDGSFLIWAPNVDRRVDPMLLAKMEDVARRFGRPLTITSGYRSPQRNQKAGGAERSTHMQGNAIDISGHGLSAEDVNTLIAIASSMGIRGLGVYNSRSMHFDIRTGARVGWGPDRTSRSVPGYARAAMNKHRSGGFA